MRLYFAHSRANRAILRRLELQAEAELGIEIYNPYYDGSLGFYPQDNCECQNHIDFVTFMVDQCDGILVVPEDAGIEVSFTIVIARNLGRKIYVITKEHRDCPWLQVYADCIFSGWDAFREFLPQTY